MLTELTNGAPPSALQAALEKHLAGAARAWLHEALAEADSHAATQAAPTGESPAPTGEAAPTGRTASTGEAAPTGERPAPTGQTAPTGEAAPTGQHAPSTRQHAPPSGSLPTWELRFAEAGRHCRPAPVATSGPDHGAGPDAAEDLAAAARVLLLHTVRAGHGTAGRLYAHGTAAERRAVLLALPHLGTLTPPGSALPLVEDALRTNDTRLVAAAVGPYAAEHLDQHAWRHAVLKCLFTGVPVDAVDRLASRARADAELARMLGDYAAERTAAGRPVPDDLHRVLALTAHPDTTAPGSLTARADTTARPDTTAAPTEES